MRAGLSQDWTTQTLQRDNVVRKSATNFVEQNKRRAHEKKTIPTGGYSKMFPKTVEQPRTYAKKPKEIVDQKIPTRIMHQYIYNDGLLEPDDHEAPVVQQVPKKTVPPVRIPIAAPIENIAPIVQPAHNHDTKVVNINAIKNLISSTGSGCPKLLDQTSKSASMTSRTQSMWTSNLSKNNTSNCVLELKRKQEDLILKITVTPFRRGCPKKCVVATSQQPSFNYKILEEAWTFDASQTNGDDDIIEQSIQFPISKVLQYLSLTFQGTHDFSNAHRILGLSVHYMDKETAKKNRVPLKTLPSKTPVVKQEQTIKSAPRVQRPSVSVVAKPVVNNYVQEDFSPPTKEVIQQVPQRMRSIKSIASPISQKTVSLPEQKPKQTEMLRASIENIPPFLPPYLQSKIEQNPFVEPKSLEPIKQPPMQYTPVKQVRASIEKQPTLRSSVDEQSTPYRKSNPAMLRTPKRSIDQDMSIIVRNILNSAKKPTSAKKLPIVAFGRSSSTSKERPNSHKTTPKKSSPLKPHIDKPRVIDLAFNAQEVRAMTPYKPKQQNSFSLTPKVIDFNKSISESRISTSDISEEQVEKVNNDSSFFSVDKLSINFEEAFSPEERVESPTEEKDNTNLRIEDLEAPPSPQLPAVVQLPIAQSALDRVAERLRTQAALRKQLQEMQTRSSPMKSLSVEPEVQPESVVPEPITRQSPEPESINPELESAHEPEPLHTNENGIDDAENSSDSEIVIELDDSETELSQTQDVPPPIPTTSPTYDEYTRFDSPTGTPKRYTDTSLTCKSWEIEKTPYKNAILHSSTPDLRALKSEHGKYSQLLLQTIKKNDIVGTNQLIKGSLVTMYMYKSQRDHTIKASKRIIKLDPSLAHLMIESTGKLLFRKKSERIPISDIQWIVYGPYSKLFKQYIQTDRSLVPYRCFTFVTENGSTFNFESGTDNEVGTWIMCIQHLVYRNIVNNERPLYTFTRIKFQSIRMKLEKQDKTLAYIVQEAVQKIRSEEEDT